jgi:hypothetical protein
MLTAGQAVQQGDWQRRWQQTLVSDRIWSAQQLAQLRQAPWSLQLAFGRDDSRQPTETPDTACRFQCSPWLEAISAPDQALWSSSGAAAVPFCAFAAWSASQPGPPSRPVLAELQAATLAAFCHSEDARKLINSTHFCYSEGGHQLTYCVHFGSPTPQSTGMQQPLLLLPAPCCCPPLTVVVDTVSVCQR